MYIVNTLIKTPSSSASYTKREPVDTLFTKSLNLIISYILRIYV